MASGQPANVQAYLNKYKITQLFEVRARATATCWKIIFRKRIYDVDDIPVCIADVCTCISPERQELTALLVKELPAAPLDFLIQKLQARKKKVR